MTVWRLNEQLAFPDPHYGDDDGLIAVGGDLSADRLLLAYSNGIFPWYSFRSYDGEEGSDEILWYCPLDRFVIFPEEIHVSHSMRTLINSGAYSVTVDRCFGMVINRCAHAGGRYDMEGAWLGPDMIAAYTRLHDMGFAHSVEVWKDGELAGGLYGVAIGTSFFGESMFSDKPSASKLALIHLASMLSGRGGLIDCQFETPHLKSMGGRHIPYDDYMRIISREELE